MKRDVHPAYQTCTVTCGCGNTFTTRSTKPKIAVEICSKCHPFFTGKQKFVDTAGMVEKFQKKYASAAYAAAKAPKVKKAAKGVAATSPLKGTNFDLALASAPGTPKAPPPAPGKSRFGRGGRRGEGMGDAEAGSAPAEAPGKATEGKKESTGKPKAGPEGAPAKPQAAAPKPAEAPKPAAAKPAEDKPAPAAPQAAKPAAPPTA
jgi:large subunit ribosomal protein L31